MKTLVLLVALLALASATLVQSHDYWYTAQKTLVKSNFPFADYAWNYCDLKCLYFEHFYKTTDFVWIDFNAGTFKPNFAACFVATNVSATNITYALWNTVVTNNTWYNTNCGGDTANYWALSQGANPPYTVTKVMGAGIGNYPVY